MVIIVLLVNSSVIELKLKNVKCLEIESINRPSCRGRKYFLVIIEVSNITFCSILFKYLPNLIFDCYLIYEEFKIEEFKIQIFYPA
jgi:hypothetical protein